MRTPVVLLLLWLAGCRYGGRNGDALALVEPEVDASADASGEAGPSPSQDSGAPSGGSDAAAAEAGLASEAGAIEAGASEAGASDGGVGDGEAGSEEVCAPNALPGCDPVHNEGCSDGFTQCVLDPTALDPAGHCVVGMAEQTPCAESIYTSSCPVGSTCLEGACRTFCRCDADCLDGGTCSEALASVPSGELRLCAPAP